MVPAAKQYLLSRIPDHKGEIADQSVETLLVPGKIGEQNKFCITNRFRAPVRGQRFEQVVTIVQPDIRGDHAASFCMSKRLFLKLQFGGRGEKCMSQTYRSVVPTIAAVRAALFEHAAHRMHVAFGDGSLVEIE